jgi:hypothetical protein
MTFTKPGSRVGGYRREVDYQKLGPALLIASSLVLAIRTARWDVTHSDGLANVEWEKEVGQRPHREDCSYASDLSASRPLSIERRSLVCCDR